jgi:hypothetical protein
MALVDMDMKYADVISCEEAIAYLDTRAEAPRPPVTAT